MNILWFAIGFVCGITAVVLLMWLLDRRRYRKLRDLLDWLDEDLDARKLVDLRAEERISMLKGLLP